MIKPYKYILLSALVSLMAAGCGDNVNPPDTGGSRDYPDFTATICDAASRAYNKSWEQGDEIGISGCNRSNVCHHTINGDGSFSVKNSSEQIYFMDRKKTDFTAYYPWNELAEGVVGIKADTRDQSRQKSFDFLWAKASGNNDSPNVAFKFAHRMSKLAITVRPGTETSLEELKTAVLSFEGLRHTGSFKTDDGATSVDEVKGPWTFSNFAKFNDAEKTVTFSLIFFPQVLDQPLKFLAKLNSYGSNDFSISATIDFSNANREIDGADARNEWIAGRQYNLTLTINKNVVILDKCKIEPWNVIKGEDIVVD